MTQPNQYILRLTGGDLPAQSFPLSHFPFTLGRSQDRDCVVIDKSVSREHAVLQEEGDGIYVVDQASRCGTFVNGEKVERRRLRAGDQCAWDRCRGQCCDSGAKAKTRRAQRGPTRKTSGQGSELERLRWFLDAARTLNEFGAIDDILVSLVQITLQLTKVERGFVFLTGEDGSLRLAAGRTRDGAVQQDDSTISRSAIKQAIKGASKFIITDTHSAEAEGRSESMVVHSIRSVICIPLRRRSSEETSTAPEMMGVLYLDSRLHAGKMSLVEHDLLEVIAKEAAALLENAYLVKSEVAARKYRTELAIASQIQHGLMKVQVPRLNYAEVAARSVPCLEIGGDFFDVIESHGALYVVIADISGKGISAALLASTLQGLLYGAVQSGLPLPEIAALANQFIFNESVGKYATMIMIRVTEDGLVEYMNCGHVKPLVATGDKVVQLHESNLVVGLLPNVTYESATYQLQDGERLLLVTDGVTEAENEAGDFYGDDALEAVAMQSSADQILDEIRAFIGNAPSTDDCTIVELRYRRVDAA